MFDYIITAIIDLRKETVQSRAVEAARVKKLPRMSANFENWGKDWGNLEAYLTQQPQCLQTKNSRSVFRLIPSLPSAFNQCKLQKSTELLCKKRDRRVFSGY